MEVQTPRKDKYGVNEEEVDGDLLVGLLESFRYGNNLYKHPTGDIVSEAPTATTTIASVDDDDDKSPGNVSVQGSTSSLVTSGSEIQIENQENRTDSTEQDNDLLEADSTDVPIVEQLTNEGSGIEIEEEKSTSTETTEEPDMEKLLAMQERYDLFCPNCKSCITKRVILKKRKRVQHVSAEELKPETPMEPEKADEVDEIEPPVKVPAVCPDSDDSDEEEEEEEEPQVFSCLSCLRFFLRLGTRFMLLNIFKNRREPVQQRVDGQDQPISGSGETPPFDSSLASPSCGTEEEHHQDLTAGDASSKDKDDGPNLEWENIRPSDSDPKQKEMPHGDDAQDMIFPPSDQKTSSGYMQQSSKKMGTSWWWRLSDINVDHILGSTKLPMPSEPLRVFWWWKPSTITIDQIQGKDRLQVTVRSGTSSTSDTMIPSGEMNRDREVFGHEVLKSIVYGGLTEAISSLGVVSSAAASGASTLNISVLAIANLVGGLILCAHNLRDLRNGNVDLVISQSGEQQKDRYSELLGRRANFRFHAFVTVLSYILFGLIPPLVYAFSFHQTGNRNHTVLSVFLVSLVCIGLLGLIKAYVSEPPKSYVKSVVYYVGIAVSSSGISYVVGDIVGGFLEKVGWFDLNQTGMTSVLDGTKAAELDLAFI